ncbi:MAG: hypothetical protein WBD22_12450 [Pyrinomonadaceae bacterium]
MKKIVLDTKKLTCKHGDYCIGKVAALSDHSLHLKAQDYKRKISGLMRPLSGENISLIPKAKGYYVSRKYDGEFAMIVFDGETLISVNPGGTVRTGLPCFKEAEALLRKAKVASCVLGAEFYVKEGASKGNLVQQVVGILRAPAKKTDLDKVGLAVFDVIEVNGETPDSTKAVFDHLKKWFVSGRLVHCVDFTVADKSETLLEAFTEWVIGEGSEGIVVRHDKGGWYKVKVRHNLDVAVIGFSEGEDQRKGMLHDLLVAVMRTDGTLHELGRVGGGFSDDDRRSIVADLRKITAPSDYVAVNNDYVAYEMVKPGVIIEISCLDLIAENTKGAPIKRMVLSWDGKRYSALTRMPLVSVISPQFVGIREDKEASVEDVSISQVSELVSVSEADKPAERNEAPPSKLIERTVYKKEMRGNTMVRKLLLWKTNKQDTGEFPGYVVYLTDFSPNRKNPLERDIEIANDEKSARALFDKLAKKNFISGWVKVS